MSKISDQFYYLTKVKQQCGLCNKIIKYYAELILYVVCIQKKQLKI